MDRFHRGLVAGMVAGVAMNLWTLVALFVLQWEVIRFIDWAAIFLFGDLPRSHLQGLFSLWMQILWAGLLGVGFAFLIPQATSRGYLIKAAFFGVMLGFISYAIPTALQMPILSKLSFATVFSNHVGGLVWGLTLGVTLRWLDRRPVRI